MYFLGPIQQMKKITSQFIIFPIFCTVLEVGLVRKVPKTEKFYKRKACMLFEKVLCLHVIQRFCQRCVTQWYENFKITKHL